MKNGLEIDKDDIPIISGMFHYCNGTKEWYKNGLLHKLDGPAIEFFNGTKEWYYEGKFIDVSSQQEFERHLKLKREIKLKLFW